LPDPADLISAQGGLDEHVPEVNPALQAINEGLVKLARLIVIPEMLLSQYSDKSRCFMGLLAGIGRAWMTVDERLYLWDFKGVRDVTVWAGEEASGPIIDVKLVRPRTGVFVDAIKWLLVIVTPVEIRLLGVQLDSGSGDLTLHDTKLIFGSDQVNMLSTAASSDGRIFCGGQDGHIYELEYEAEEGWFTRRCRKVNRTGSVLARLAPTFLRPSGQLLGGSPSAAVVALKYDASREYLWSLTEGGQVSLFSTAPGSHGWSPVNSFVFHPEEIHRLYPSLARSAIGDRLVDIHPVSREESRRLSLVGVTVSGLRLYYGSNGADRPYELGLVGLRAPQPLHDLKTSGKSVKFNLTFLAASMANVHSSYQQVGLYAAAGALSDAEDILIVRSAKPSAGGSAGQQLEASSEWRLDGKVWDISEAPLGSWSPAAGPSVESSSRWWDELVRSHLVLPRQLFCLTNAGTPPDRPCSS
jgi:nuclear pore complex protein Nup155